jgi:hypothetical protein
MWKKNSVFRRFVKSDISQKTNLDRNSKFIGTDNKKLIGIAPLHNTILKFIP